VPGAGSALGVQPPLLLAELLELVAALGVMVELQQDAEEVHAVDEHDEAHGAVEGPDAGLPRYPAAARRKHHR